MFKFAYLKDSRELNECLTCLWVLLGGLRLGGVSCAGGHCSQTFAGDGALVKSVGRNEEAVSSAETCWAEDGGPNPITRRV